MKGFYYRLVEMSAMTVVILCKFQPHVSFSFANNLPIHFISIKASSKKMQQKSLNYLLFGSKADAF